MPAEVSGGGARARVVLVTGGAKGIGAGISREFLQAGDIVVVCGRTAPEELPEVAGSAAEFHTCDVRDPDAVAALVTEVMNSLGYESNPKQVRIVE